MTKHNTKSSEAERDRPMQNQSGGVCSDEIFKGADCLRDSLRHIDERWKKARILNDAGFIQKYVEGEFSLVLDFGYNPTSIDTLVPSGFYGNSDIHRIMVIIDKFQPFYEKWCDDWDEQSVFVTNVEFVEGPQKAVRSLVRAYLVGDEFPDAGDGLLYAGIAASAFAAAPAGDTRIGSIGSKGAYQFLPLFPHGKGYSRVASPENGADTVIKCAFQRMDRITDQKGDGRWKRLIGTDAESICACFSIFLKDELAEIRFFPEIVPHGLKLRDMMIGPFVL